MFTSDATATPSTVGPRKVLFSATRLVNPLVMLLAGTRLLPLYGVIHHRGRRSGKQFRTPVVVRPIPGGLIVPMPWGETTDWFRNVRAADGCVIHWKGRDYRLVDPVVLNADQALSAFGGPTRVGMTRFGIKKVMQIRFED
jgi:deazaflavin-dependent oxidoreductase (nitroreductase family)